MTSIEKLSAWVDKPQTPDYLALNEAYHSATREYVSIMEEIAKLAGLYFDRHNSVFRGEKWDDKVFIYDLCARVREDCARRVCERECELLKRLGLE